MSLITPLVSVPTVAIIPNTSSLSTMFFGVNSPPVFQIFYYKPTIITSHENSETHSLILGKFDENQQVENMVKKRNTSRV